MVSSVLRSTFCVSGLTQDSLYSPVVDVELPGEVVYCLALAGEAGDFEVALFEEGVGVAIVEDAMGHRAVQADLYLLFLGLVG